jgi:hypothetical protein
MPQARLTRTAPTGSIVHAMTAAQPRSMARYTILLVAALCIYSPCIATASRLLRQAAAEGNSTSPGPSPLSQVYNATTMANSPNFTFWQEYDTRVTGSPGKEGFAVQLVNRTNPAQNIRWESCRADLQAAGQHNKGSGEATAHPCTLTCYVLIWRPIPHVHAF